MLMALSHQSNPIKELFIGLCLRNNILYFEDNFMLYFESSQPELILYILLKKHNSLIMD